MFNTADAAVPFNVHEDHGVVAFVFAIHMHPEGTVEVCLAGCSGCSSSQAGKRIRPRIINLWSDIFVSCEVTTPAQQADAP